MDNSRAREALATGQGRLGLGLSEASQTDLLRYLEVLLKWNERVNLTAITEPVEVVEKHLLDSLAVLAEVPAGPRRVLDVGAGAGLPGIPWAVVRPDLDVTLVDAVQKKVAFMKTAIATLGLAKRARAVHQRAEGAGDGLGTFDLVVSRAFTDLGRWLPLAVQYLAPQGRIICMLGQAVDGAVVEAAASKSGVSLKGSRRFELPLSGDGRGVMVFER